MKLKLFLLELVGLLLLLSLAGTALTLEQHRASYDLIGDKALVTIHLQFREKTNEIIWPVPNDATAIEVPGRSFAIEQSKDSLLLRITGAAFNQVEVKYLTSSPIEKTKDRFFILNLAGIPALQHDVTLYLPEGATLKYSLNSGKASILPTATEVRTDGKRIIIHWNGEDLSAKDALLVIYTPLKKNNSWLLAGIATIIVILIGGGVWYYFHRPRKALAAKSGSGSDLTRNLFEEEKIIIEKLLEAPGQELWQKQLEIKTGLSKVKLSRKLRNLEQKGLIEKIPYGNTNKIRVKKD